MNLPVEVGEQRQTPSGPATEIRDAEGRTVAVVYAGPVAAAQLVWAVNGVSVMQAGAEPDRWVYPHR